MEPTTSQWDAGLNRHQGNFESGQKGPLELVGSLCFWWSQVWCSGQTGRPSFEAVVNVMQWAGSWHTWGLVPVQELALHDWAQSHAFSSLQLPCL